MVMESLVTVLLLGVVGLGIGVVGVLGVMVAQYRKIVAIEDATNHRHTRVGKDGQPPGKLYDLALEISNQMTHLVQRVDGHEKEQAAHADLLRRYGDQIDMLNRALETRGIPVEDRQATLDEARRTPPPSPQGT